jgi:hypothetical protein
MKVRNCDSHHLPLGAPLLPVLPCSARRFSLLIASLTLALVPATAEQKPWVLSTVFNRRLVLRLMDNLARLLMHCAADPLPAQVEELYAALSTLVRLLIIVLSLAEAKDFPLGSYCGRLYGQTLGQPSLVVLCARDGLLGEPAAYFEVQALETKEGPPLGYEGLVSLEVDSERAPALGYEGVAGKLRHDRERSAGLWAALDSLRGSPYGLGLQDRRSAGGRLAGQVQVGLVDSRFGGPERLVQVWGSSCA